MSILLREILHINELCRTVLLSAVQFCSKLQKSCRLKSYEQRSNDYVFRAGVTRLWFKRIKEHPENSLHKWLPRRVRYGEQLCSDTLV